MNKINFIKIALIERKVFSEFCEIKQYKIHSDQYIVINYKMDNQILKINKEK